MKSAKPKVMKKLKNVAKGFLFNSPIPILIASSLASSVATAQLQSQEERSGLASQSPYLSPFSKPVNSANSFFYPSTETYGDAIGIILPSLVTTAATIYSQPGTDAPVADRIPAQTVPGTAPMSPVDAERGTVSGSTSEESD